MYIPWLKNTLFLGFLCGTVGRNLPTSVGDTGSIPGLGRFHMPQSSYICGLQLLSLCSRSHELQLPSLCAAAIEARGLTARALQ